MGMRGIWLLGLGLVAAVVLLLVFDPLGTSQGEISGDGPADDATSGPATAKGPELEVRDESAVRRPPAETATPTPPDDLWTIEVTEVVGPDGRALPGADVYLDLERTVNRTWTWDGDPLRIHLRPWVNDYARVQENERAGYVECDDTPVYLSVRHEGFATWFAAPLRYGKGKVVQLRARLGTRRTVHGIVLNQDGKRARHLSGVTLRPAHVPADMFAIEASWDYDGRRYVFDDEEPIPVGPLVVEASVYGGHRFTQGLPASVELGSDEDEFVLALRRAHRFRFLLTVVEQEVSETLFAQRHVRFLPRAGARPDVYLRYERFCPVPCERRPSSDVEVLVPEGDREVWRAFVPGYREARLELRAGGQERDHTVEARLVPAPDSGLLLLDIESPEPRMHNVFVKLMDPDTKRDSQECAHWSVGGSKRTRRAVRLPSGTRRDLQVEVQVQRQRLPGRWLIPPIDVVLASGQRLERRLTLSESCTLQVTRKREGGLMPDLHVRFTQGAAVRTWTRWFNTRDLETMRKVYGMLGRVEAGPCTVELVRAGELLPWSARVHLVAGKVHVVRVPDEIVLPRKR